MEAERKNNEGKAWGNERKGGKRGKFNHGDTEGRENRGRIGWDKVRSAASALLITHLSFNLQRLQGEACLVFISHQKRTNGPGV